MSPWAPFRRHEITNSNTNTELISKMGNLVSSNMVGQKMFQKGGTTKGNRFYILCPLIMELAWNSHYGIGFGLLLESGKCTRALWGLGLVIPKMHGQVSD